MTTSTATHLTSLQLRDLLFCDHPLVTIHYCGSGNWSIFVEGLYAGTYWVG